MKTIIIAGITRSGLTLTMQMLYAGGYPCFGEYPAFEGYEIGEIPFVKLIGKVIKVVDTHIQFPLKGEYYVIRLRRDYKQQAKSMCKFMNTIGLPVPASRETLRKLEKSFNSDYSKIDIWAKKQKGFLIMDFEEMILNPKRSAEKINEFTGQSLNTEKMIKVVAKRNTECYPTMMELDFLK